MSLSTSPITESAATFSAKLAASVRRCRTPVMVGLDPRLEQLPGCLIRGRDLSHVDEVAEAYQLFCRGVLDVVAPLVGVVKPQAAFFEEIGPAGMKALADVIRYARQRGLLVVLDGKRNDIGTTAQAYARGYLAKSPGGWNADALTVSPYLGDDSLTPFVEVAEQHGAGIFVLVKTSNPGGGMFQDLVANNRRLFEHVADYVELLAQRTCGGRGSEYGCVGAVVGATYPQQLAELRQRMPHAWLLVPGYGAQGAAARDVAGAFDAAGLGAVVNNSRGIIFAQQRSEYKDRFPGGRWQDAVAAATREMIDQLRNETPAKSL